MAKEAGYVYILTNPSFREDWVKIGKSSRPVDVRSKELDNTAVPLPFDIFATLKTVKYEIVEKKIHKAIDRLTDLRIRQNREFFNIKPELALEILRDEATILDDAEITLYKNNVPILENVEEDHGEETEHRKQRPRFKFSMVGIPIGSELVFTFKLSPFVGSYMPAEKRNASGAYQGAKFFTYNGEVLDDVRTRVENSRH